MNSRALILPSKKLQSLIDCLIQSGYRCIGPQARNGAIVFDTLTDIEQLPRGYTDQQSPGNYRLEQENTDKYFSWTTGPQAIKPFVFSPVEQLWSSSKDQSGVLRFNQNLPEENKQAIIGVRACDLAALYLQDKHFLHDNCKDPWYLARRQNMLLIAVNCTRSAATCFCVSTDDGPRTQYGYDVALTELDDGFIANSLTEHGKNLLAQLDLSLASDEQCENADQAIQHAAKQQRKLPNNNLKQALFNNLQHAAWDETGERCLSCGNCTAVCPTCFCHHDTEQPDISGQSSMHTRQWDSCFTAEHSYIHGIIIRNQTSQRYRQWLTHKLGSWHDQFGRSGCVGCGRCITWCPVGIDITQEVYRITGLK